jgi:hypothetical protein
MAITFAMVRQLAVSYQAFILRTKVIIDAIEIETDDLLSHTAFGKVWLNGNEANKQANGDHDWCILLTAFTKGLLPLFTTEDLACLLLICHQCHGKLFACTRPA